MGRIRDKIGRQLSHTHKRPYVDRPYSTQKKRKCKAQVHRLSSKRPEDLMSETGKVRRKTGQPEIEFLGRPKPWAVMLSRKEEYNHI
ncbi:hypothetical protein TNCV_1856591 [Trichonephila clavipes]|nr:hypothetical protein TNCV_1856591 [Trichonephila clavipes]